MFVMYLNDMRSPNIENVEPVARAETRQLLETFYESQRVKQQYRDGQWGKRFKKGGPLEWYNELNYFGQIVYVGTKEDAANRWQKHVDSIPEIGEINA